jgi:hypothetical protein
MCIYLNLDVRDTEALHTQYHLLYSRPNSLGCRIRILKTLGVLYSTLRTAITRMEIDKL